MTPEEDRARRAKRARERRARGLAPDDARHGTRPGYFGYGCRCDPCRAAGRAANAEQREQRKGQSLSTTDPRHGKISTYVSWHCRCDLCKSAARADQARRTYGITPERYAEMMEEQEGRCAICKVNFSDSLAPCVDHDHSCCRIERESFKKACGDCVRGLLCQSCNKGLGNFRDDQSLLVAAAAYLAGSLALVAPTGSE